MLQNYLSHKAAVYLTNQFHTRVTVGGVDFAFLNSFILEKVFVEDLQCDTLAYIDKLTAKLSGIDFKKNKIILGKVDLQKLTFNLSFDRVDTFNLDFILDYFDSGAPSTDTTSSDWNFIIKNISAHQSNFSYINYFNPDSIQYPHKINWDSIVVRNIDVEARDLFVQNGSVYFNIKHLSLTEQNGLDVNYISGNCMVNERKIFVSAFHYQTPKSNLNADYVVLNYKHFVADMIDFENQVVLYVSVRNNSSLYLGDIKYFTHYFNGLDQQVTISGIIFGTIADFKGRKLDMKFGKQSLLLGYFDMKNYKLNAVVNRLISNRTDIALIKLLPFTDNVRVELPQMFDNLGNMVFNGKVTGPFDNLLIQGSLVTRIGNILPHVTVSLDSLDGLRIAGNIRTDKFDYANFLDIHQPSATLSGDATFDFYDDKDDKYTCNLSTNLNDIFFNNYFYKQLQLTSTFKDNKVAGYIEILDKNLTLKMNGVYDFQKATSYMNFTADIKNAKLGKLNLLGQDTATNLSCLLKANFAGNKIDNINGNIDIYNTIFQNSEGKYSESKIRISALEDSVRLGFLEKILKFESNFLDAKITGRYLFSELFQSLNNIVPRFVPSLKPMFLNIKENNSKNVAITFFDVNKYKQLKDYSFQINLKNVTPVLKLFLPGASISEKSNISGNYDLMSNKIFVDAQSDKIVLDNNKIKNLQLNAFSVDSQLIVKINCNSFQTFSNIEFLKLNIDAETHNDSLNLNVNWDNKAKNNTWGKVQAITHFFYNTKRKAPYLYCDILPSKINIRDSLWYIDPGRIVVDSAYLCFQNFKIHHKGEWFKIRGAISSSDKDTFRIQLYQFNLGHLNLLTDEMGFHFDGIINGNSILTGSSTNKIFYSNLVINSFKLNKDSLGDFSVRSSWLPSPQKLQMHVFAKKQTGSEFDLFGSYTPSTDEIDFDIGLDKFSLKIFAPFMKDYITDFKGYASTSNLKLQGTLSEPLLNGNLKLENVDFVFDYLKTHYQINGNVDVNPSSFILTNCVAKDVFGKTADITGKLSHTHFHSFNYDFNVAAKNFMLLNTTEKDNQLYYGKAFATGLVKVKGDLDKVKIDFSAKTERNTQLFLPLILSGEVSQNNFITFNKIDTITEPATTISPSSDLSGIQLNFDLDVTPDAECQIIFDSRSGDIIKSRGFGNLNLEINSAGNFAIFGDYVIDKGDYLFNLKDIINKKFDIKKGSTIKFNGGPYQADLDIDAIYSIKKASLYDLFFEDEYKNKKIPVDCHLFLTDKLRSPAIKFGIDIPVQNVDERIKTQLNGLPEDDLNIQILSLLLLNRFQPMPGANTTQLAKNSGAVNTNTGELLTNQLNVLLSQISNKIDINVNYQMGDSLQNSQIQLALSKHFFNDRVTLNGNVAYGEKQAKTSNVVGDVEVDVKLNESGKLRLKAFTRSDEYQLIDDNQYTQGLGLFYREDFNKWSDIFKRFWSRVTRAESKNKTEQKK